MKIGLYTGNIPCTAVHWPKPDKTANFEIYSEYISCQARFWPESEREPLTQKITGSVAD
jgi:hypothetical protein